MSDTVVRFKLNARIVCTKAIRMPVSALPPTPTAKSAAKPPIKPLVKQPAPVVTSQTPNPPTKKRGRTSSHVPHPSVTSVSLTETDLNNQPITQSINQSMDNFILGTVQNVSQSTINQSIGQSPLVDNSMFPYRGPVIGKIKHKQPNKRSTGQLMDTSDDRSESPSVFQTQFPVIIPSTASWFDYDSIHQTERSAFPEIFNQSINQTNNSSAINIYKTIRNQLIDCYRMNPRVYLTITAARRFINQSNNPTANQSINQIIAIHTFLQKWGLINFQNDFGSGPLLGTYTKAKCELPLLVTQPLKYTANQTINQSNNQSNNQSSAQSNGLSNRQTNNQRKSPTPVLSHLYEFPAHSSNQSNNQSSSQSPTMQSVEQLNKLSNNQSSNQVYRSSLVGPVKSQDRLAHDAHWSLLTQGRTCSSCNQPINQSKNQANNSGEELFYQSSINQAINLCVNCFASGIFPDFSVAADFVRMSSLDFLPSINQSINQTTLSVGQPINQPTNQPINQTIVWSRADTFRLLDLIREHGDDWELISRLIDRSPDDCVAHFISLPIEDPFTEQYSRKNNQSINQSNNQSNNHSNSVPMDESSDDQSINQSINQPVLPFSDVANPLLAQIAFLASTVSPAVAAAAAQAASQEITKQCMREQLSQTIANVQSNNQSNNQVDTVAGAGDLLASRPDGIVEVKLPFGKLYAPVDSIDPILSSQQLKSIAQSSLPSMNQSINQSNNQTNNQLSAVAIGAACVKANELSNEEERKLLRLVAELIQAQVKKCELKMQHLTALNEFVDGQTANLETQRLAIITEQGKVQNQLNSINTIANSHATSSLSMG